MGPTETSILVHLLVQCDHSRRKIPRNVYSPSIDRHKMLIPIFPPIKVSKRFITLKFFYARVSTICHAPSYCTADFTTTPSSLAARRTKSGWRKSSRASRTRSALPSATRSFGCCDVVIIPTVYMMMSGCGASLIASANGTCEENENGCYHVIVSPICVSPYLVPRPDRSPLSYPVSPGADIDQIDPELLVNKMLCSMAHCNHFPPDSESRVLPRSLSPI